MRVISARGKCGECGQSYRREIVVVVTSSGLPVKAEQMSWCERCGSPLPTVVDPRPEGLQERRIRLAEEHRQAFGP